MLKLCWMKLVGTLSHLGSTCTQLERSWAQVSPYSGQLGGLYRIHLGAPEGDPSSMLQQSSPVLTTTWALSAHLVACLNQLLANSNQLGGKLSQLDAILRPIRAMNENIYPSSLFHLASSLVPLPMFTFPSSWPDGMRGAIELIPQNAILQPPI